MTNQSNTATSKKPGRPPSRFFEQRVETQIARSLTEIDAACHQSAISDILCRQFELTMRCELVDIKPDYQLRTTHIKTSCESFIREHESLLRSRDPNDMYSLLINPTDSSAQDRFAPTLYTPGSEDKLLVLIARAEAGLPLWHPHDASYDAERNALLQELGILPEGE